jgi:hypothetical protein
MVKENATRLNLIIPNKCYASLQKFVLQRKLEKMESGNKNLPANLSDITAETLDYFIAAHSKEQIKE